MPLPARRGLLCLHFLLVQGISHDLPEFRHAELNRDSGWIVPVACPVQEAPGQVSCLLFLVCCLGSSFQGWCYRGFLHSTYICFPFYFYFLSYLLNWKFITSSMSCSTLFPSICYKKVVSLMFLVWGNWTTAALTRYSLVFLVVQSNRSLSSHKIRIISHATFCGVHLRCVVA